MLVQYNLANTCSCFISRVFWIEETDNKCNKGGICLLGLPVGDNEGEMCKYTEILDGLTIKLENDLKAVLVFTRSNTPNGNQPKLWQPARQLSLLPVKTAECSLWILHDNFCQSLRQYFLIFSAPDAARKKMKTYLEMGHSGKFRNLVSVKNFNFQNPFVVPIVLVYFFMKFSRE